MARLAYLLAFIVLIPTTFAQENIVIKKPDPNKPKDSTSYAIGFKMGQNLGGGGFGANDLVYEEFINGLKDALSKGKCKLTDDEIQKTFIALEEKMMKRMQDKAKSNLDDAAKFLEENKKADGVQTIPAGVQYKVLATGNGTKPTLTSTVKVHYEGKLMDGTVFDSSIARGEPIEFKVTGVIKGWTEALTRMKVGDKWQLFIPPSLAYGENPPPGSSIEPNSLLIFQVELLDVK